ncbi:MAG: hypothetical protein WD448_06455 [Woeseia sp.]
MSQTVFPLKEVNQQVSAQRYPDLSQDRVLAGSYERLYFQVLLDPLEKKLDLPTVFVDIRDGSCGKLGMVGQIVVLLTRFTVFVSNPAKLALIHGPFFRGQFNQIVAGNAVLLIDLETLYYQVLHISLGASHKVDALIIQIIKPLIVDVASIHRQDTIFG